MIDAVSRSFSYLPRKVYQRLLCDFGKVLGYQLHGPTKTSSKLDDKLHDLSRIILLIIARLVKNVEKMTPERHTSLLDLFLGLREGFHWCVRNNDVWSRVVFNVYEVVGYILEETNKIKGYKTVVRRMRLVKWFMIILRKMMLEHLQRIQTRKKEDRAVPKENVCPFDIEKVALNGSENDVQVSQGQMVAAMMRVIMVLAGIMEGKSDTTPIEKQHLRTVCERIRQVSEFISVSEKLRMEFDRVMQGSVI